jgi:hypothetical protein
MEGLVEVGTLSDLGATDDQGLIEIKDPDFLKNLTPNRAYQNLEAVRDMDPDAEARRLNLSKTSGLSWSTVRAKEQAVQQQVYFPDMHTMQWLAPGTVRYFTDLANAAVSKDDAENLAKVESTWSKVKKSWQVGTQNVEGGKLYTEKLVHALAGTDNPELDKKIAAYEASRIKPPEDDNFIETGLTAAAEMLPILKETVLSGQAEGLAYATAFGVGALALGQMGPQVALPEEVITVPGAVATGYFAGVKVGSAKSIFQIEAGLAYQEMGEIKDETGQPIDSRIAAVASIGIGGVNAGLEFTGLKAISKLIPGGQYLVGRFIAEPVKKALQNPSVRDALLGVAIKYAGAVGTETWTEMAQEVVTILGTEVAKTVTEETKGAEFGESETNNLSRILEAGKQAFAATVTLGIPGVTVSSAHRINQIQKTQQFQDRFTKLAEAVEVTKTKQRDPERLETFINSIGASEPAYLSAEGIQTLFQSDPENAQTLLNQIAENPELAQKAAIDGQDVKVDTAKIMAFMTPEQQESIKIDLKPAPSALSPREIQDIDFNEELKNVEDYYKEIVEAESTFRDEMNQLRKQVTDTGYSPEYADNYLQIVERFVDRMSLEGLNKQEFVKKISVQYQGEVIDPNGIQYNQEGSILTESEAFKNWFGESKVVNEIGKPVVVYRGDTEPVETYKESKLEQGTQLLGGGFYFVDNRIDALEYGVKNPIKGFSGSNTNAFYLSLKNPYVIDVEGRNIRAVQPETSDYARDNGYDGVILKNVIDGRGFVVSGTNKPKTEYIVFKPTQIKSVFNQGTFNPKDPNILKQTKEPFKVRQLFQNVMEKLGFYSDVLRSVEAMDFKQIPGKELVARLKKLPRVKKEELDHLGIIEWLDGIEGKVSKEDVIHFIEQGGVQLEEIVKGESGLTKVFSVDSPEDQDFYSVYDVQNNELFTGTEREADVFISEWEVDTGKYKNYTLPGGKNYREVLLTLPETKSDFSEIKRRYDELDSAYHSRTLSVSEENERTRLYNKLAMGERPDSYKSSHWDESNVLAHFRLDDRIDSEGRKTLFIEEIQSDWHQEGRRKGYIDLLKAKKIEQEFSQYSKKLAEKYNLNPAQNLTMYARLVNMTSAEVIEYERLQQAWVSTKKSTPDAPFKSSWPLLAFKRILRMAAEESYDSVAWTPGNIQADRYDLSEQVEAIGYEKRGSLYNISVWDKKEKRVYSNQSVTIQDVENVLGKEIADKIQKGEGELDGTLTYLTGLDLKVGGEGMKAFYDKMLPSIVQGYIKKLDKNAKVETSKIDTGKGDLPDLGLPSEREYLASRLNESESVVAYVKRKETETRKKTVWYLHLTDQLKEKVLAGQALFQPATDQPRGGVNITDEKHLVNIFRNKDLSTLIHETGHIFLKEMRQLYRVKDVSDQFKQDYELLLKWLDLKAIDYDRYVEMAGIGLLNLTESQQAEWRVLDKDVRAKLEKFAKGFEVYLMEGKAPTADLIPVFQRFKNWLFSVYKSALGLDVELNDEVRSVFDHMFTIRQEVFNAAQVNDITLPTKSELDALGVVADDRAYMQRLYKKAIADAEEALHRERNANRRGSIKTWRTMAEKQYDEDPTNRFIKFLSEGVGLSKADLLETFGEDAVDLITKKRVPPVVTEKGMGLLEASVIGGYQNSNEMVKALINVQKKEDFVKAWMAEEDKRHDSLYKAEDFIAGTEAFSDFLEIKNKYLKRSQGVPTEATPWRAFQAYAKQRFGSMKVKDAIAHHTYLAAYAKHSKLEKSKIGQGKFGEAAKANETTRLNYEMAKQAIANRKAVEKTEKAVKRLLKSKAVTADTRYQLFDLAARFGLVTRQTSEDLNAALARVREAVPKEDRALLIDWIDAKAEQGYEIQLPRFILDATKVQNYKDLPFSEFEKLAESFDVLRTIDREERFYTALGKAIELEKVVDGLETQLFSAVEVKALKRLDESALKLFFSGMNAVHTKMEFLLRKLDGGKVNGIWWNYFFKPIADAESNRDDRLKVIRKKLKSKDLFGRFSGSDLEGLFHKRVFTDGMPLSMTKNQVLSVALNVGTIDNKAKLLDGYGWTEGQLNNILDNLTEQDWQFAQNVWDYVGSFKTESFAVAKEMTGKRPEEVKAEPVQTKFGEIPGGYYPLVYDSRLSFTSFMHQQANDLKGLFRKVHATANTKPGSHFERLASAGGQKVKLDLSVVSDHLFEVVHDITHRKAVINVSKLIRDKRLQKSLTSTIGIDMQSQLRDWLQDVAQEKSNPSDSFHRLLRWARVGTTVMNLGLKATTTVTQFVGYTQTINALGIKQAAKGLNMFYGYGSDYTGIGTRIDFVLEKSGFLRNRLMSHDRDIRDAIKNLSPGKKLNANVRRFAFLSIGLAQMGVDLPTWYAAYDKAINDSIDLDPIEADRKAIDYADSIVRQTQGAGGTKDLAKIQRGDEAMRVFTMFYGFFNTLYNLASVRISAAKKISDIPALAASALWLWFVPALLAEMVAGRGPEDDDEWGEWALPLLAMYPFQTVVGVRDFSNYAFGKYGYQATPAQAAPKEIADFFGQIDKAIEEKDAEKALKQTAETVGYIMKWPMKQVIITVGNVYDYVTGEDPEFEIRDLFFTKQKK